MATSKVCDRCGKHGAKELRVAYSVVGDVIEGKLTTTMFASDVCDACRDAEYDVLFARARDQHDRHVPIQRELIAARVEHGEIKKAKDAAVAARDKHHAEHGRDAPTTKDNPYGRVWANEQAMHEHKKLADDVNDHMERLEANERRQREILEKAK